MTAPKDLIERYNNLSPPKWNFTWDKSVFTVHFDLDSGNPYNISYLLAFEDELLRRFYFEVEASEVRGGSIEVDYRVKDENDVVRLRQMVEGGGVDDLAIKYQINRVTFPGRLILGRTHTFSD